MPLQNAFMLLLLGTIWGASYMFIKVSVAEITPLTFVVLRTGLGGGLLALFLLLRGRRLPGRSLWKPLFVMGLFNTLIPYGLINWGELYISSALAAILTGTMPLFTVILAHFWSKDERMDWYKAVGVVIGFLGVVVLLAPDVREGIVHNIAGDLAVMGAGLSYAIAAVFARRHLTGHEPAVLSAGMLLAGFVMTIPLAFAFERPLALSPSPRAWAATLTLAILGTAIAYLIYYWILEHGGAVQASLVTYIIPVGALFWGWLLLGEDIRWTSLVGLAGILLGIMVSNRFRILKSASH
ncbi:MAG: DMT family transporter [Chloroflexi bacterium]|nr:DMT family transporter [Chloroflexota bacterium]